MGQIQAIQLKMQSAKEVKDLKRVEILEQGLERLSQTLKDMSKPNNSDKKYSSVAALKHITSWTNQVKRRKDGDIFQEYLENSYRNIHRNEIIVDLLEATNVYADNQMPKGTTEYLVNRIKMAFNDSDTRASTIFGNKGGHQRTADWINNNIPSWMRGGTIQTAESAERLTKYFTIPSTAKYLGMEGAAGNQTQILNKIIQVGFRTAHKAYKLSKNRPNLVKKAVENSGVLNVLNMFSDIMSIDGDTKWNDFLFLPKQIPGIGGAPNPFQVVPFINILRKGRKSFINSKNDDTDRMLVIMQLRKKGVSRAAIREMQDLRKMKKMIGQKALESQRGAFFDFYTLDKEQSEEMVEKRFKALVGTLADVKLKQWVTWKLSWWFDEVGGPGKDFFTFTEGEKKLREFTVVMALVHAMDKGSLPADYDTVLNAAPTEAMDSILLSDHAAKIARDAVYNTQFGMTPMYLGEGFNGIGRLIFQYKQYPTLQTIYDYQTFKKFTDGNYGTADGIQRLVTAAYDAGKRSLSYDKSKTYDPKSSEIDHEALAMLRFIFTRMIASVIGTAISVVPFMGRMLRGNGTTAFGILRSGESPILGLAFRTLVWASIIGMNSDDDDSEGAIEDLFGQFKFLLLPVLISSLLEDGMKLYEKVSSQGD